MAKTRHTDGNAVLRYKFFWILGKVFQIPFIKYQTGCKTKKIPAELRKSRDPFIVVVNRSSPLDIYFVVSGFKKPLKFVINQQDLGKGFSAKSRFWKYSPIVKLQSSTDKFSTFQILKSIRNKQNICIFQGEEPSFSGVTSDINPEIGNLIKKAGVKLVTYKLKGGYFTKPVWSEGIRKGKVTGEVVNIYEKEQIKELSAEQITKLIKNDIFEDAYRTQKYDHICYRGTKIAEGMETCVCVCPKCHRIGTIKTEDNSVFCESCGEYTEVDDFGYFRNGFMFHTLEDWDNWQTDYLNKYTEKLLANTSSERIFSDENVQLNRIENFFTEITSEKGSFALYKNYFVFKSTLTEITVAISDIESVSFYKNNRLNIILTDGTHYQLCFDSNRNLRKYLIVINSLKNHL